jgi:uncharacterized protein YacL
MAIFKTFKSWKTYFLSSCKSVLIGLVRIVWSFILGIASIAVAIWKTVKAFCQREFVASLVIGAMFVAMVALWVATFVNERAHRVSAEMQRDSISYQLQRYTGTMEQPATDNIPSHE